MSLLLNILGAPIIGPAKFVKFISEKIDEVVQQELGDEDKLKGQLIEWQIKLELGGITQAEYDKKENEIMKRIQLLNLT